MPAGHDVRDRAVPGWCLTPDAFVARDGVGATARVAEQLAAAEPHGFQATLAFGRETLVAHVPHAWRHTFRVGTREKPDSETLVVLDGPGGTRRILAYYEPRGVPIPADAFTDRPMGFVTAGLMMREGIVLDAWTDPQYRRTALLLRLVREAFRRGAVDMRGPFSSERLGRVAHRLVVAAALRRGDPVPLTVRLATATRASSEARRAPRRRATVVR